MNNDVYLASTLSSLKFISSSQLVKTSTNLKAVGKYVKEFKLKLFESLASNQLSDLFLKNVAECLYDLNLCDRKTSYHLSRSFETRAGIISNQLKGGVLWAYCNDPSCNRARRKVINSSCRVAIMQATREFLHLKENVTSITKFDSILRNLKVVGDCYKVPISPKTRLEHSILESSEVFKLSFECYPLLNSMCKACCSLLIDNERIGSLMVEIFSEYLQNEVIPLSEICSVTRVLYKWKIARVSETVQCIQLLKEWLESGKYCFTKNVTNTVKLLAAAVRLPESVVGRELSELILQNSAGRIEAFCSNQDLVLLFNSVAQLKRSYPESNIVNLDALVSNLETFLLFGNADVKRKDVNTINRSCKILKGVVKVDKLLEISTNLLDR